MRWCDRAPTEASPLKRTEDGLVEVNLEVVALVVALDGAVAVAGAAAHAAHGGAAEEGLEEVEGVAEVAEAGGWGEEEGGGCEEKQGEACDCGERLTRGWGARAPPPPMPPEPFRPASP